MGIKARYFSLEEIKSIRNDVEYIGSDGLKEELDEIINCELEDYGCNVFSYYAIKELENLSKDWKINVLNGVDEYEQ